MGPCKQLGGGGTWKNDDLKKWYACLEENCVDQTKLWDGVPCSQALTMLKCSSSADMAGGGFIGTVADACPTLCKAKCKKSKTRTNTTDGGGKAPYGGSKDPYGGRKKDPPYGGGKDAPYGGGKEVPYGGGKDVPYGGGQDDPYGGGKKRSI